MPNTPSRAARERLQKFMSGAEPVVKTSAILVRGVDPEKHAIFKARCARQGRTLRGAMIAFIDEVTRPLDDGVERGHASVNFPRLLRRHPLPK